MSDPAPAAGSWFIRDVMRLATVIGIVLGASTVIEADWVVMTTAEAWRAQAAAGMVVPGLGLFASSVLGHAAQLWIEK